jgi:hypothetical protein
MNVSSLPKLQKCISFFDLIFFIFKSRILLADLNNEEGYKDLPPHEMQTNENIKKHEHPIVTNSFMKDNKRKSSTKNTKHIAI